MERFAKGSGTASGKPYIKRTVKVPDQEHLVPGAFRAEKSRFALIVYSDATTIVREKAAAGAVLIWIR